MSAAESVFNIPATSIMLGAKLANGSPGVSLFEADLRVGQHTTKVCSVIIICCLRLMALTQSHVQQVAVKKLQTSGAPATEEILFLKEVQTLQLASYACQRVCRMIGCCRLDGNACIVMSLYSQSAAKRLEEVQGQCSICWYADTALQV